MAPAHSTRLVSFLDLPAELRVKIYQESLAPTGVLSLTSKDHNFAVVPEICPALLRACKQVHSEAEGVLYEGNEISITVEPHGFGFPAVPESRLPRDMLGKIQHLCVIVDCTPRDSGYSCSTMNYEIVESLVSLKTLRLTVVYRKFLRWGSTSRSYEREEDIVHLLSEWTRRVPALEHVSYTIDEHTEAQQYALVKDLLKRREPGAWGMGQSLYILDLPDIAKRHSLRQQ